MEKTVLNSINFKDTLRSAPLRENFTNIQTNLNAAKSAIEALSASTSTSEIIAARDGHGTLQARLNSGFGAFRDAVLSRNFTIESFDTTTNLIPETDVTLSLNSTLKIQGSNCVEVDCSSSGNRVLGIQTSTSPAFLEYQDLYISVYVEDTTALSNLTSITIYISDESASAALTNYEVKTFTDLSVGWNSLKFAAGSGTSVGTGLNYSGSTLGIKVQFTITSADTYYLDYAYIRGTGLQVQAQATPATTVKILEGSATIDGYGVYTDEVPATTAFTFPTTNPRWDSITIDRNSDIFIWTGEEASTPDILPTPAGHIKLCDIYQRVGASSIKSTDDSTNSYIIDRRRFLSGDETLTALPYSIIVDASGGGTFSTIQEAVDYVGTSGGDIYIRKGTYTEEVDLSGYSDISLIYEAGAVHIRPDTGRCIKAVNTVGTSQSNIKILGGDFQGDASAAGAYELFLFEYISKIEIQRAVADGNVSSTATSAIAEFSNSSLFCHIDADARGINTIDSRGVLFDNSSVSFGENNRIYTKNTFCMGESIQLESQDSGAIGNTLESEPAASHSFLHGKNSYATREGEYVHANGIFSTKGDAQFTRFIQKVATTDATKTEMSSPYFTLKDEKTYLLKVSVVARQDTGASSASWTYPNSAGELLMVERTGGTTTLYIGGSATSITADTPHTYKGTGSAWDLDISADDTNDRLKIEVTGAASANIRWVAVIEACEVGYTD